MDPSVRTFDLALPDGRTLHGYDRPPVGGETRLTVYWHGGTPNIGAPPEPLFALSDELGVRWLGHDRPGYGVSTPLPGRSIGQVASDVAAVLDRLGVERFAAMGSSGGGPHTLACAAVLADRFTAGVSISGPAPYTTEFDWFAGMADPAELQAAVAGRAALGRLLAEADPEAAPPFIAADWDALQNGWSWLMDVVMPALASGHGPFIDDDLATVGDWGFDVSAISRPILLLHGGADQMVPAAHAERLSTLIPGSELRITPADGHVSVLAHAPEALRWLCG